MDIDINYDLIAELDTSEASASDPSLERYGHDHQKLEHCPQ